MMCKRTISSKEKSPHSQQGNGGFPFWECMRIFFFMWGHFNFADIAIFLPIVLDHDGVTHDGFHSDTFINKILYGYFLLFFDELRDSRTNASEPCISKTVNKQKTFEMIVRNRLKIRFFQNHPVLIIYFSCGEAVVAYPKFEIRNCSRNNL